MRVPTAIIYGARLEGAFLSGARLEGADLTRAHLERANLRLGTGLTEEQLAAAAGDGRTQLPAGVARPAHWPEAASGETTDRDQPQLRTDDMETQRRHPLSSGDPDGAGG
ncbi:MAG: pentapeptide repeat-containing protein [Acetobacteraceae bacterium]|nr:pentapeptide repeat-containing protein [Acetobacteraceae bacterium]